MRSRRKPVVKTSTRKRKPRMPQKENLLDLVKSGIRQFVLRGAPISDLKKVVLEASKKRKFYAHPLTGAIFRDIVKEAIRERGQAITKKSPS